MFLPDAAYKHFSRPPCMWLYLFFSEIGTLEVIQQNFWRWEVLIIQKYPKLSLFFKPSFRWRKSQHWDMPSWKTTRTYLGTIFPNFKSQPTGCPSDASSSCFRDGVTVEFACQALGAIRKRYPATRRTLGLWWPAPGSCKSGKREAESVAGLPSFHRKVWVNEHWGPN